MADILSTSGINSLIESYISSETTKLVSPLKKTKSKYQDLSTAYSNLSSKLALLKSVLTDFTSTGTSSLFNAKIASTSNAGFVTASVNSSAAASNYSLRINQLAKSDLVLSNMFTASNSNAIATGSHTFAIKTGDGSTGEFTSNVEVEFDDSETNQTVMEKVRDAINSDKALINSTEKTGDTAYSGGISSFKIDLNGTETTINVNGGGTYSDLITEVANAINSNVDGVTAEVITNSGNVNLRLTVDDNTKYISISHVSGTDLVSELAIGVTKEKAAAGIVNASAFSPSTGNYQFSISSKESGLDFRIKDLHDTSGTALNSLGLNISTTRTAFDQDANTAGFLYADDSASGNLLNAKVNFNGLDIQRNSNTISDLSAGVTFSLKSVMQSSDTTVNVTTSNDVKGIRGKLENFIARFNDVYSYLKTNSSWSSGSRGVLVSDAVAASLVNLFRSSSYGKIPGLSDDSLNMLSKIGITFSSANGLSITDGNTLESELESNSSEVEALFNSTDGLANSLYESINPYLGSGGYLTTSQNAFNSNSTRYADKIKSTEKRIDKNAEALREKYQQLQARLAAMYTMSNNFSAGGFFSSE